MAPQARIAQLLGALALGLAAGTLAHSPTVAGLAACTFALFWEVLDRDR